MPLLQDKLTIQTWHFLIIIILILGHDDFGQEDAGTYFCIVVMTNGANQDRKVTHLCHC